jgi:hypothetical protein
MNRIRILAIAAFVAFAAAAAGVAFAAGDDPGLPGGWTHAEINYADGSGAHTLILDRGTVQSVSAGGIVLREADGSLVEIPVAAETRVRVNGRPAKVRAIRVGFRADARRVDGGAAKLVRAFRT